MSRIVMPFAASSQIRGADTRRDDVSTCDWRAGLFRFGVGSRVSAPPRVAFVLEQSLGHVTHADNLIRLLTPDPADPGDVRTDRLRPRPPVGAASRLRLLDGARRDPRSARPAKAGPRRAIRRALRPHPGRRDVDARCAAQDTERGVARRDADPVRRARPLLRALHERPPHRAHQMAPESDVLRPRRSADRVVALGQAGPGRSLRGTA